MSTSSLRTAFFQSVSVRSQPQRAANSFSDASFRPQATFRTGSAATSKKYLAWRQPLLCAFPMKLWPMRATLSFFMAAPP